MIEYISRNERKNLILLVHGFTGGKSTWVDKNVDRIPNYLIKNEEINLNFDIAYYDYYTKVIDKIDKVRYLFGLIAGSKRKFKKNLSIDDIKDVLFSHLENEFKKYNKVVIIAHSMGGLISKAAILKLIEKDNNKVSLFLSLCVPHNGSALANLGKLILKNPNLNDLAPLSIIIDQVTRKWLNPKSIEFLPETVYYQGKNDIVVPNESSEGYEARDVEVVYSDDDHSSILSPLNSETIVISSIITKITNSLKKKDNAEKSLIKAEISAESLELLTKKISHKLGYSIPKFESLENNIDKVPQLSSNISNRVETIENIFAESNKNWIALYGMHDTGKTQLSVLVFIHLNLETIWINLKDVNTQSFSKKLYNAFEANTVEELESQLKIITTDNKVLIVLDDLPKFGLDDSIDQLFNSFITMCLRMNVVIFSTSNHKLSNSIISIHSSNVNEKVIPLLSKSECLEVIDSYEGSKNFTHRESLFVITEGYPIYLQIVCRFLDKNNWLIGKDNLLEFFTGSLFTELTDETLLKLMQKVEDDESREILYRLNAIRTKITENEIMTISSCDPVINKPMEKVTNLTGSWIQRNNQEFIVSPLIKRLGVNNLSKVLIKEVNLKLGNALLAKSPLSQYEVQDLIIYFKNSDDYERVGFVILNFLKFCISQPSIYFDYNFSLYTYGLIELPTGMSLFLRLYIRSIHLNLEAHNPNSNEKTLAFLRNDLKLLVDDAIESKIDVHFPSLILSSSYIKEDSAIALKYFTFYINSYTFKQQSQLNIERLDEFIKFDNNIIWLLLINIDNIVSLDQWFSNIETLGEAIIETDSEQSFFLSDRLINNFIDREKKLEIPDWEKLFEEFSIIYEKAVQIKLLSLQGLTLKYHIKLLSEEANDIIAAEQLYLEKLKLGLLKNAKNLFLASDELGRQFYYKENKEKAKEYLIKSEYIIVGKHIVYKVETYLALARLIGSTDEKLAHQYMVNGLEFIKDNAFIDEISYIQYIGEFATSLSLISKNDKSIVKFIEGYELLLDSFEENTVYINTQIRFGNAIGYLNYYLEFEKDPGEGFTKPYRGFIGNNNDLTDLYFPEKLLINIFQIVTYFELVQNYDKAEYWAFKMFTLKDKYPMTIFHKILSTLLGYLIKNDKLNEAFKLELEIIDVSNKLLKINPTEIDHPIKKDLVISMQARHQETITNKDPELEITLFGFLPILIHLLNKRLSDKIETSELITKCKEILIINSASFTNQKVLYELKYIFENFPENLSDALNLLEYSNKIEKDIFQYIQIPVYLICSIFKDSKLALEMHFTISQAFKLYKGSLNIFVLNPFLKAFWMYKLNEDSSIFNNPRKFIENLQKTEKLKMSIQTEAIFALAAEQLNYSLTNENELWLKEYTDEFE